MDWLVRGGLEHGGGSTTLARGYDRLRDTNTNRKEYIVNTRKFAITLSKKEVYRVGHLLADLGWVD